MPEKILITGGAGFIGSHLAERLVSQGKEVTVIDDLSTGRIENISSLLKCKGFTFCRETIFNQRRVRKLIKQSDAVYHLAAAVGVKYIIEHPLKSLQTNIRGTEIVLDSAAEFGRLTFLASTSEIYGKNDRELLKEDDDRILGPTTIYRWSYSCTKALDEFLALAYFKERKLPVVIGRFFNICGPRQTGRYGMVVPRFIRQALSGEPITVYGDGRQVRSFTYISDALDAVALLLQNPQSAGDIFNIGGYESITILELAYLIKKIAKSSSEIVHIPYQDAYPSGFEDMRYRVPDITKLSNLTGYKPKVTMEEMMRLIAAYHSERNPEKY
ncbi:MAG: GDP-mannose 4,6-dehydratase [Candidatus Omnitrophica bacterium]|nr:GDP-mannose 4,6-dehydratase [Candidatus Omnitrophota bacterium]